jgi:hypothetical protein
MNNEQEKTILEVVKLLEIAQDSLRVCDDYICGISDNSIHLRENWFAKIANDSPVTSEWANGSLHLSCEKDGRKYITVLL